MRCMDRKRLAAVMIVVSMVFGMTVAILGVTGSDAISLVAMIGGGVVGIGWVIVGKLDTKERA